MKYQLSTLLASERQRWLLWLPVPVAAGVALYFALQREPTLQQAMIATVILAAAVIGWRRWKILQAILIVMLLVNVGFAAAKLRTESVRAPFLTSAIEGAEGEGVIAEVASTPKGMKFLLEDVNITGLGLDETPRRISLTWRKADESMRTGSRVEFYGTLYPPPAPVVPGGFDFGRYFYFKQIGANGFAMRVSSIENKQPNDIELVISDWRHRLSERIRAGMNMPEGSVAAALVTGETRAIPESVNDSMRAAGLYHLLAVSGMNLAVVSGLIFFFVRFVLVAIPGFALRFNVKRWAGVLALVGSFAYLLIAGSPVSAERAFVMVALVLIAVIIDREVHPMRSLMIAAFLILLFQPESLVHAGFQLSFAATIGLVAFYEALERRWRIEEMNQRTWLQRVWFYLFGIIMVPLVAGLATAPLLIYDFQRFQSYSLLSNMLVDPLVTFIMMPAVMLGLLLMPLGLEGVAFAPLQWSITLMLKVAAWVGSLPGAEIKTPPMPVGGALLVAVGLLWLCLWERRWRYVGLLPIVAGTATIFFATYPDVLLDEEGKYAAVKLEQGKYALARGRGTGFTSEQWADYLAVDAFEKKGNYGDALRCDKSGCVYEKNGMRVAFPETPAAMEEWCWKADVVMPGAKAGYDYCPADLFTAMDEGSIALTLKPQDLRFVTAKEKQGVRPWVR